MFTSIVCGGAGAVLLADGGNVLVMDKSTVCRYVYVGIRV